jgi:Tfp pilus assembly protein PilW
MKILNTKYKIQNTESQKGFTIVELLLYMGIFSMLLVVLLQLFSTILSSHAESQATSSVDQDGAYLLARLAYDIHKASGITSGSNCTWPIVPSCQLALSNGISYQITPAGNLTINGAVDPLNSVETKITNMQFTTLVNPSTFQLPNPKPSIQISFTLQSKTIRTGGQPQAQTFQTTVQTR